MGRYGSTKYYVWIKNNRNCKEEIEGLEIEQNKADRRWLGANKHSGIETLRGGMGWSSFESRIHQTKIKYKTRLELKKGTNWAKKNV